MAIYIGTKRIDGGGSSDPSIVKLATNYDANIQMYSIPVFCSSTDGNLISPNHIHEYDNSLKIIPEFGSMGSYISNINEYTLNNPLNMFNRSYPGIEIYNHGGARIISSMDGQIGSVWFSMEPNWNGGNIVCKLWDGFRNDASSNKGSWYYTDTNLGFIYPQIYTTSGESFGGSRTIQYINTILDLVNDESIDSEAATINLNANSGGTAALIVRETADIAQFASDTLLANHRPIVYGPNFSENAAKGAAGDPSIIVCYSFLFTKSYILVNAAQYKEA